MIDRCRYAEPRIDRLLDLLEEFKACDNPLPMDTATRIAKVPHKKARFWLCMHGVCYNRRDGWHLSSNIMENFPDQHHDRLKQIFEVV